MSLGIPLSAPARPAASPLTPDTATLERFLAHSHRRRYPARADVFRPGDPAGTLYYVVSGSVSIITEEDDDRELVLGYFGSGEFVGEMGLFIESDRREVILRTRTQCELAEISYERLHQLFADLRNAAVAAATHPSGIRRVDGGAFDPAIDSQGHSSAAVKACDKALQQTCTEQVVGHDQQVVAADPCCAGDDGMTVRSRPVHHTAWFKRHSGRLSDPGQTSLDLIGTMSSNDHRPRDPRSRHLAH